MPVSNSNEAAEQPLPKTSRQAIASLVFGLLGFVLWILASIPAIILGVLALRKIEQSNGSQRGNGLAITGICAGATSLFLFPLLVALALPAFQAIRETKLRDQTLENLKQWQGAMENHKAKKEAGDLE